MKKLFYILFILFLAGCNKPKTVLICGDHVCINKQEAKQFFEDNLTLEVKVIEKKKAESLNLVELNLEYNSNEKKEIKIFKKEKTNKEIKKLSDEEIKKRKKEIKKRRALIEKRNKDKEIVRETKLKTKEKKLLKENKAQQSSLINKKNKTITDICDILKECTIDEISKYLVKKGKENDFPDITTRELK